MKLSKVIVALLVTMRPKQWTKNIVVFAGAFFAHRFLETQTVVKEISAFFLFCLVSGSVYLLNDIFDRHKDAQHPKKRTRPIAAGQLSVGVAAVTSAVLIIACLVTSYFLHPNLTLVLAIYYTTTFFYSFRLKQVIILDVLLIGSGFVLRAIGGVVVINAEISTWFLICTIFLSLFLALVKRQCEMAALGEFAGQHRKTLQLYTPQLLDQMISVATASAIISYSLYTLDDATIEKFGTRYLVLTVPFVLYGVFRYLHVGYNLQRGDSPEIALLSDRPLILNFILYIITLILVIYL